MQKPSAVLLVTCHAADLFPVNEEVVARGPHGTPRQRFNGAAGQFPKFFLPRLPRPVEEGKIQIAPVVIDRPAPGQPSGHCDFAASAESGTALQVGALVISQDHRGVVDPQIKTALPFLQLPQQRLLQRQVFVHLAGAGDHQPIHDNGWLPP